MDRTLEAIHLPESGEVQLSFGRDGERRLCSPVSFPPLWSDGGDASGSPEAAWYFGGYLANPFGPSRPRAAEVEARLRDLGRRLFETVLGGNEDALRCYATAAADGLEEYSLVIISPEASFLALPWELLNEPALGYLAGRLSAIERRLNAESLPEYASRLPVDQLNVLLVSPWPEPSSAQTAAGSGPAHGTGTGDAPQHLAVETLSVLDSLEVPVALDVLRPATIGALTSLLGARPDHYHAVHFDGCGLRGPGALTFEAEGGSQEVQASQVGELLARAGVPLALLYPGEAGPAAFHEAWASAPAGLVSGGVPVAVSAPFPLPPAAARSFLQRFYLGLAEGTDVALAVSGARSALMSEPHRASPGGKTVLWDWLGPTVYRSRAYVPAAITREQPEPATPAAAASQPAAADRPTDPLPQAGPYGLVGRRQELARLERLFDLGPVNLLWGDTGVGKSELALGFARWVNSSGARPGGVFYSSLEAGAGLERLIHETGTAIMGLAFADMPFDQARAWLLGYLRENPSLLIWDSVETAAGFPGSESAMLDSEEQSALAAFLEEATQGGESWVLVISRRSGEPWLSAPFGTFHLEGLTRRDAIELGNQALEATGVVGPAADRDPELHLGPDYLDLLEFLEGHPLAMQIALPLLREAPASAVRREVSAAIAGLAPNDGEEARPRCLTGLMDYSFSRMSRRSRTHLPFLSLFQRRIMLDVLTHMTQERAYRGLMGEELSWGACRTLLRAARDAGFLEQVTPSVFQIHPSLPWFYSRRLHGQTSQANIGRLEREFVRVYTDTADYFLETLQENQDSGATAVLAEEANLMQALGLALETRQWDSAQVLVQPLAQVYSMQKRRPELRRLRRQLMESLTPNGQGAGEAYAAGGIDLWLYLTGTEANDAREAGELEHAEDLNRRLVAYLTSLPEAGSDPRTGAVYHQLGLIAQQRWDPDLAEDFFLRSLRVVEGNDDPEAAPAAADNYYCLGQVRHRQRRYAEAKEWLSKALAIHQLSGDPEELVKDYRALGLASQYRMEHDEAESWYQRARAILEENRDEETAILVYHELGTVCHARYQFEEAESWYRQALALSDRLGQERQLATEFHHLGLLHQTRGVLYDEAEEWYLLALEKYEALGDRTAAGDECRQLGVLFHQQKRLDAAEEWYQRACAIFQETGDLYRTARTYGQLGMVAEDRDDLPNALHWVALTYQLAADNGLPLLPQAKAHLARLRDKYGEDSFRSWWASSVGSEPPDDLETEE